MVNKYQSIITLLNTHCNFERLAYRSHNRKDFSEVVVVGYHTTDEKDWAWSREAEKGMGGDTQAGGNAEQRPWGRAAGRWWADFPLISE